MDHPVRWNKDYSVKIAELDLQHQQLFQIAAQLDSAQCDGRSDSIIGGILDKLIEHIISHFTAEEYLMEQHEFPNLTAHRQEHQMLAQKLAKFNLSYKAGKPDIPSSLLAFLQKAMIQHTLTRDQEYRAFLDATRYPGSASV